ncbi:MAG: cytochrome c3 family protein [Acidobacteriota bacterium]
MHPDLEAAHDGEPLGNSRCTGCHDAHASNIDKRLPEFSHGPYDARLCSDCHADPVDGEVRLVAENINALCYGCHEEVQMRIEGAQSSHKLLSESDRSCVECHDPHAANQETVLIEPVYELCIGCHGEKPEKPSIPSPQEVMQSERLEELNTEDGGYIDLSLEHVHAPVRKSCTLCHDAHASEFTAELHAPVYELCMECHGENAEIILNSDQPFPFLNGLVSLPPKSYEELPYLDLNEEFVHDPVLKSCVYCHNAHSSQNQDELYAPVNNLCLACHNDSNAERILKSSRPFPLFGGKVLLPPNTFEKMSELHLAKGGSVGHPMQNHPVYIPATDEEPEFNCLTCHISHAASTGLRRWKDEDRNNLCFECHKM